MPILGDPLMDAGCDDEKIIAHCRANNHNLNCSLLNVILGTWYQVYELMDMEAEYEDQADQFNLVTPCTHWPILVLEGVTSSKVIKALKKAGCDVYSYYDDLDRQITKNDRDPKNGSYVIKVKANVEADEENKNQSANQRREKKCKDITLLERLLLELVYFLATKQHLDMENWTLCAGSRYDGGYVPDVGWRSGNPGVHVCWRNPGNASARLRARSVSVLTA